MAFFHNRTVNLLNLHYAITQVAIGGGGAFVSAYMLRAGIGVPTVLLALAVIFALRLVVRSFLLTLAIRTGLRWLVVIGAVLMAAIYPVLAEVHGIDAYFYGVILISATADTIYWPSYHAYFAALGDAEHRGQQLGLREAVVALLGIVSPLLAGWLLVNFGARTAFGVTAAIQALSAVPLLWMPDIVVQRHAPGAFRAAIPGAALFVGDGLVAAGYFVVWQIVLFLALGENYLAYGGALAVAALVGAVGGLVLGRYIDSGNGGRAVWYAIGLLMVVIVLRAGVQQHPVLAVAANAFGSLVACLYIPTMMTAVYNQAKRSPCVLRFQIAAEGGWDIGIASGLAAASLLVRLGAPLSFTILMSLLGAAAVFVLLRGYYAANPSAQVDGARQAGEFEAPRI